MNLNRAVAFLCSERMCRWARCWDGCGHWDELLAELAGESAQRSLLGLEHLGFVLLQAVLDVVDALDHDAPEQRSALTSERLVGDQAAATCCHANHRAVERTKPSRGHAARGKTPRQNCTSFMVRVQFRLGTGN